MKLDKVFLGIDTSCYTTSIAAISIEGKILFNEKIMLDTPKNQKGLRQSEAVFKHTNNLGILSEKIKNKLKNKSIEAICVSKAPRKFSDSYMPVFTVGYNFSKLLATTNNCKLYTTTHQENHIKAALIDNTLQNEDKFLTFHMSGGTTELLLSQKTKDGYKTKIVGATKDISFGQLIDRIGVRLGYDFPCGKNLDNNALVCENDFFENLKISTKDADMNLSGLENQIEKLIEKGYDNTYISKVTFDLIIKNIEKVLNFACDKYNVKEVLFVGGVSSSCYIREKIKDKLDKNIKLYFTKPEYATDNALGCAFLGLSKYQSGVCNLEDEIEFSEVLKRKSCEVEEILKKYIPREEGFHKNIVKAMKYSLLSGGKRLRPILTIEACKVVGGNVKDAYPFAIAVEMIHTYSLIHDDLPQLDNDDLRRGRPTNHKVFGEDMAILAGDALLNYAFEVMLSGSIGKENPEKYLLAINEIAKSAGIEGMIGGQVVDIESEGKLIQKDKLHYIHLNKTAALIIGCMRAGAIIGNATEHELNMISYYAKKIGIAFQVVDDILDVEGEEEKLGKKVGSDIERKKSTYPSILGMKTSKEIANELIEEAKDKISEFEESEFLVNLADYIISREN